MAQLPTPTQKTVPSDDIRDHVYAGGMLDKVVTSTDLKYTDRLGGEHYTVDGMKAEGDKVVEATRQNLIPLSRQYMTLAAAQADIANIPAGSTTYYRSPDDSALAIEVINNGGTLEATGRRMVSEEGVNAQFEKVNERIFNTPPNLGEYAAAVEFPGGRYAPFMNSAGRLVYIDEKGVEQLAAADADVLTRPFINAQSQVLPDGSVCLKVVIEPSSNRIVEAWTEDGGYYFSTPTGLKRVGNLSTVAQQVNYSTGVTSSLYLGYGATRLSSDNDDTNIIYILPTFGQSLAQGWTTATVDTLIATVNLYPDNMFMFESSRGSGKENPNRGVAPIDNFSPLIETINGGWHETACSSSAAHIISAVEGLTGQRIKILRYVAADGGKAYRDLTKGTTSWSTLIQGMIDAKRICERMGFRSVVLGLDFKGGETDTDRDTRMYPQLYTRFLQNLDRNFNTEVKRIFGGQHAEVPIFVEQCSWQPFASWDNRVRQGQLDADARGNIRFTGASYQFDHSGDVIHLNSRGQNSRGVSLARAVVFECFGTGFIPLKVEKAYWSSTSTIDVVCQTSDAIIADTSGLVVSLNGLNGGGGFKVRNLAGAQEELTITGITTVNAIDPEISRIVRLTVNNPSNIRNVQIGYGLFRTGTTNQSGPIDGARGIIRTIDGITNLYTGAVEYQWLPAFRMEIN